MFVVLLKLTGDRAEARRHMDAPQAWIRRGFDDGVFLLVGNLQPQAGGGLLAHNTTRAELESRVNDDPLVAAGLAIPEIIEIAPQRADARLGFLHG